MSTISGDSYKFETDDGKLLEFPSDDQFLIEYGNFGAPPVEFVTRRGYKQHGVTEVDYFLQPRSLEFHIHHNAVSGNRNDYWDLRNELVDFFRHSRGGPILFTVIMPDGRNRSIYVRANPGIVFPPNQQDENNWSVDEPLEFTAFDPIWFDSREVTAVVNASASSDLVFPITFPIRFGVSNSGVSSSFTITYDGTWISYPTITLTGPYTRVTISNQTTGARIGLSVGIGAGETRVIDLTSGDQSIVDGSGNNKFSDLDPSSNLIDFGILPDPQAEDGINLITIEMVDGVQASGSSASMTYKVRYFGI